MAVESLILSSDEKKRFIECLLKMEGWDYCWPNEENNYSGKGLPYAKYQNCADCSGAVTIALYEATDGRVDLRATHNANALYKLTTALQHECQALPGDLVFYGPGLNALTHVMVAMEHTSQNDCRVFGACGGDSRTTSPEVAKRVGARVRYRRSVHYRPDFKAVGRF